MWNSTMSDQTATQTRLKARPSGQALSRIGCVTVHHGHQVSVEALVADVMTITRQQGFSKAFGFACTHAAPDTPADSRAIMASE
jgi:hypothetical protein